MFERRRSRRIHRARRVGPPSPRRQVLSVLGISAGLLITAPVWMTLLNVLWAVVQWLSQWVVAWLCFTSVFLLISWIIRSWRDFWYSVPTEPVKPVTPHPHGFLPSSRQRHALPAYRKEEA